MADAALAHFAHVPRGGSGIVDHDVPAARAGQRLQPLVDPAVAIADQRFDAIGLAMEGFDPIGKRRSKDLAGRPVDDVVRLADGTDARGVPEFARNLVQQRRDDYVRTLCRKLLGYALGRSLQLSDQTLLDDMRIALDKGGDRFVPLLETIVLSPQFRHQRCRDFSTASFRNSERTPK